VKIHTVVSWGCDIILSHAIDPRIAFWFPNKFAWIESQVRSCMICGGRNGTGIDFLQGLELPMPSLIPSTAQHSFIHSVINTVYY
jgi:hypothetical protein